MIVIYGSALLCHVYKCQTKASPVARMENSSKTLLLLWCVKRTSGADAGPVRFRYYGGAISAHTATRGLFTGIWLRHVAVRSVGMIARFRLGPQ
jgi:hypothetical protein